MHVILRPRSGRVIGMFNKGFRKQWQEKFKMCLISVARRLYVYICLGFDLYHIK